MEQSVQLWLRFQKTIQAYARRLDALTWWENLPAHRRDQIRQHLDIPADDTPWAFCPTAPQDVRHGFALTPAGIYWRIPWVATIGCTQGMLLWSVFARADKKAIQKISPTELTLNRQAFIKCTSALESDILRQMLQDFHALLHLTPEDVIEQMAKMPPPVEAAATLAPSAVPKVRCEYCGNVWPATTATCPSCGAPLPTSKTQQPRTLEKAVRGIVLQYLPLVKNLYLWTNLSERKQKRARRGLRIPEGVTPWAFYDVTLLENANRGFALAPTGIYWHNTWLATATSGPHFLAWQEATEMWKAAPPFQKDYIIQVGKNLEIQIFYQEDVPLLLEMLNEIKRVLPQYL